MKGALIRWLKKQRNKRIQECTLLTVVQTHNVTPHMRRIAFSAKELDPFASIDKIHVRLLLPPEGANPKKWLKPNRQGQTEISEEHEPVFRKYTIRSVSRQKGEVVVDFVLHEDGGPGAVWAGAAEVGNVIGMASPSGREVPPVDWYLLASDEAGLPAIGRIVESLPRDASGEIIVEIAGPEEEQLLDIPPGMTLKWLHRGGAEAGTTQLLYDAIRSVDWPGQEQAVYAWAAGEFDMIKDVRRFFKKERGLDKSQQLAVAYWRRGASVAGEMISS